MPTLYTLNNKLVKAGSKFLGNLSEPSQSTPTKDTKDVPLERR